MLLTQAAGLRQDAPRPPRRPAVRGRDPATRRVSRRRPRRARPQGLSEVHSRGDSTPFRRSRRSSGRMLFSTIERDSSAPDVPLTTARANSRGSNDKLGLGTAPKSLGGRSRASKNAPRLTRSGRNFSTNRQLAKGPTRRDRDFVKHCDLPQNVRRGRDQRPRTDRLAARRPRLRPGKRPRSDASFRAGFSSSTSRRRTNA